MRTKELYSAIIDIQKKTGQGLSGVVTINQPSIRISMNNLIERGLIIKESSGYSSIGHPASNDWYMPSTGYNVWKEIREYGNLMPLFFIRKFLGDNEHASYVDENTIEYVGNAHFYFSNFIKQSDTIRRTRNPHNVKTKDMEDKFGSPNFISDYNGSYWWILEYKGNTWAVDTKIVVNSFVGIKNNSIFATAQSNKQDGLGSTQAANEGGL